MRKKKVHLISLFDVEVMTIKLQRKKEQRKLMEKKFVIKFHSADCRVYFIFYITFSRKTWMNSSNHEHFSFTDLWAYVFILFLGLADKRENVFFFSLRIKCMLSFQEVCFAEVHWPALGNVNTQWLQSSSIRE